MTPPPLAAAPPWIAPIEQALRLATAGVMILVDQAGPGVLPVLLRRLLPLYPDLEVLFSAVQLGTVAEGSVVILCPDPSEAAWLNLNRPLLSQRALRVILFCDTETAIALNRHAPDFFDWISRRVVAPTVAPPHAVAGLRALALARQVGAVYADDTWPQALAEAFPQAVVKVLSAYTPAAARGARGEPRGAVGRKRCLSSVAAPGRALGAGGAAQQEPDRAGEPALRGARLVGAARALRRA